MDLNICKIPRALLCNSGILPSAFLATNAFIHGKMKTLGIDPSLSQLKRVLPNSFNEATFPMHRQNSSESSSMGKQYSDILIYRDNRILQPIAFCDGFSTKVLQNDLIL